METKNENRILTRREEEVVRECLKGHPRKVIADDLNMSIRTLDTHLKNIHKKKHSFDGGISIVWFK